MRDQGDQNLRFYALGAGSEEFLDSQVLLEKGKIEVSIYFARLFRLTQGKLP